MKKLILSTALVLAVSVTTAFAQEKKQLSTSTKIENSTQKKTKLSSVSTKDSDAKKEVKTTCPEATKDGGCCSKSKSTEQQKQVAPPIKQRPSNHPALQQTFPGGKDANKVSVSKEETQKKGLQDKKSTTTKDKDGVSTTKQKEATKTLQRSATKK